jgi:hypothetical protein
VGFAAIILGCIFWYWPRTPPTEDPLKGEIIAGDTPTPVTRCTSKLPDPVTFFLGGNTLMVAEARTLLTIKGGAEDLLVVQESESGIKVSARIFSSDHRIVAQLVENRFVVNPNNYFKVDRPTKSIFSVYGQDGLVALEVRYLNRRALRVLGRFYSPQGGLVVLTEDSTIMGGYKSSGNCHDNTAGIFYFD